jgi:large subunit ribosomal protein L9
MVQLVLLERVSNLGMMGDIVNVKPGFARNYLLPQKKALRASEKNIKKFEAERVNLEAVNLETKKEAEKIKEAIEGKTFTIIRSASDSGSLYGSVTNRDAEMATKKEGLTLNRKQIILERPIKELGIHELMVSLHPEVISKIYINVARSLEEAEMQKSGKTIQELKNEAEAEAEFDIAELFDDVGAAAKDNIELLDDDETTSDLINKDETSPEDSTLKPQE